MNPFKSVSVALLVALGLASTASLAAEVPAMRRA